MAQTASARVLAVGSDPLEAAHMPAQLTEEPTIRVTRATSRDEAVSKLKKNGIDCVLCASDPAGSGVPELLETLREHNQTVPIVVAPRDSETDVSPEELPTGVTEYLPPAADDFIRRDLLIQRVEALTEKDIVPPARYAILGELVSVSSDPSVSFLDAIQELAEILSESLPVETLSVFECTAGKLECCTEYFPERDEHLTDGPTGIECAVDTLNELDRTTTLDALPEALRDTLSEDASGVAAPIRVDGDSVGLAIATGESFSEAEQTLFAYGADVFSWRFQRRSHTRREARIEQQNEKIRSLHRAAADLDDAETADAVYEMLIDAAESILEFDLAIADAVEDGYLRPKAVSSDLSEEQYYDETPLDPDESVAASVYQSGETSLVNDTRESDVVPADTRFLSVLTVPIGEYGIIQAAAEQVGAFDETDLELAELLVTHGHNRLRQLEQTRQLEAYTETLEEKNERLDAFASVVSHDLRNPLQVAFGHLELIKANDPAESVQTAAEEATTSLERMESLIDDLLALAAEGQMVESLDQVSVSRVATDAWQTVPTAEASLSVETDLRIVADPPRLQQLFENLFVNAIDHGGSDVAVTVGPLDDESGFYIADDGPGIDPAEQETVFDYGYTTADDGTGVGLKIVAEIVTGHDWDIAVTDSTDGGARFEISGVEIADDGPEPPQASGL